MQRSKQVSSTIANFDLLCTWEVTSKSSIQFLDLGCIDAEVFFYVCLVMLCHPYQMGYEVCYIISSKSQRELYRVLFKQKKRSLDPKNKGQIFLKIQKFILAYIISQTKPTKALNIAQVTCLCLKELI